jgi:hypothetical protein
MEIILLILGVVLAYGYGWLKGCDAGMRRYHMDPDQAVVIAFDDNDANNILWYRGDDKTFLHQSTDYKSGVEHFRKIYSKKTTIYVVKS